MVENEDRAARRALTMVEAIFVEEGQSPTALATIEFLDGEHMVGYVINDGEGGFVDAETRRRILPEQVRRIATRQFVFVRSKA